MTQTFAHMAHRAAIVLFVILAPSLVKAQSFESLIQRAQRLNDIYDVERFHQVYGYEQENLLFEDQAELFADGPGVEAHFQLGFGRVRRVPAASGLATGLAFLIPRLCRFTVQ